MTIHLNFIRLLKQFTSIDEKFIDIFFKKFKIGNELEYDINEKDVVKYLKITNRTLRERLNNNYSKNILYIENVDFIKRKEKNSSKISYYLNYQSFEKLAMSGHTKESENVRIYFSKIREFITENQNILYQAMDKSIDLKKYSMFETIYFFAVDDRYNDVFKIGRTNNIIKRLQTYNTGRIKEIDLKYLALVKNSKIIESCMKLNLKKYQIYENREIYKIDSEQIKKIIDLCYCNNVTKKENDLLYEEISELLKLYSYVKDKKNIKPYIIIGKTINKNI